MNRYYQVNDFLDPKPEPLTIVIEKKISLLYEMYILKSSRVHLRDDTRENAVRTWLAKYTTERQIENALRDVIMGTTKLDTILTREGMM